MVVRRFDVTKREAKDILVDFGYRTWAMFEIFSETNESKDDTSPVRTAKRIAALTLKTVFD
jgi:hypothetical protein